MRWFLPIKMTKKFSISVQFKEKEKENKPQFWGFNHGVPFTQYFLVEMALATTGKALIRSDRW